VPSSCIGLLYEWLMVASNGGSMVPGYCDRRHGFAEVAHQTLCLKNLFLHTGFIRVKIARKYH